MAFMFLRETIRAYRERDPAARSTLEVVLCYPGVHAVLWHKLSHWLWNHKLTYLDDFLHTYRAGSPASKFIRPPSSGVAW